MRVKVICPQCGQKTDVIHVLKGDVPKGCPIRKCNMCGAVFYDKNIHEPAIHFYTTREPMHPFAWGIRTALFLPFFIFMVVMFLYDQTHRSFTLVALVGFNLYLYGRAFIRYLRFAVNREKFLQQEEESKISYLERDRKELPLDIWVSLERLKNRNYLDALTHFGADVPEYFYKRVARLQFLAAYDISDRFDLSMFVSENKTKEKEAKRISSRFSGLCTLFSFVFYTAFIILYHKVDPLVLLGNYLLYELVIGACILFFSFTVKKRSTQRGCLLGIIIPAVLLMSVLTVRFIYNSKLDTALANIPSSGEIYIRTEVDSRIFRLTGGGIIKDKNVTLSFNGESSLSGIYCVPINEPLSLDAGISYRSSDYKVRGGHTEVTILLSKEKLNDGYQFMVKIPIEETQYCELDIAITYFVSFWDVVLS